MTLDRVEPVVISGPCPVCEGAGYWDKLTGHLVWTVGLRDGLQRCPYCEGRKVAPPREVR